MRDYSRAKIYKILNEVDDDVYIGATCQPLCVRMTEHRRYRNCANFKLYRKMREIGVEQFYIELVAETPCENIEQLNAIEGYYIRKLATLNTRIEGRTKKQYTYDTRDKKIEYDKKRREEKGDEINKKKGINITTTRNTGYGTITYVRKTMKKERTKQKFVAYVVLSSNVFREIVI